MLICDTILYAQELLAPTYEESFARPNAAAGVGEVSVDGCTIEVRDDSEQARIADEHLSSFIRQSVGGRPASDAGAGRIVLTVDPGISGGPEAHCIRVTGAEVLVAGATPVALLRGVFRLEDLMRERGGPFVPVGEETRVPLFRHRVHRSPLSPFYVEELTGERGDPFNAEWFSPGMAYPAYIEDDAGPDVFYHDNVLLRLAQHGFNGIWLRASFRHFARTSVFPEFGRDANRIMESLQDLTRRAGRYGIRVFLYLNEPLGVAEHDPFLEAHPECRGAPSTFKPMVNLCTSTPEVQTYLRESAEFVCSQVPDLAGFVMITASEYPSHCWCRSSYQPEAEKRAVGEVEACPRCRERSPFEVVGEVVRLVRDGARAAQPDAEIIVWNWSWAMWEADPQPSVLEALPDDITIMGDYERGEPTEACGFPYTNDEYNIKVVGPSQRFRGVEGFLRERGRGVWARIQIGTTHENPCVPYLPALPRIAAKYATLRDVGVEGIMSCWNFGNMPSLATELAGEMAFDPQPTPEESLRRVALRNFGPEAVDDVLAAWAILADAHDSFPGSIPVMYNGPVSRGPAFLFCFDPVDKPFPNSWLLEEDIEGDRFEWAAPFGPEKVLECYRDEAEKGALAIPLLERAAERAQGEDKHRLLRDLGVARFHLIQTTSGANVVEFLLARDAYRASTDADERRALLSRMEVLCSDEIANAEQAIPLMRADPRLGWHGEAYGPMISPALVEQKLAALREILEVRLPAER